VQSIRNHTNDRRAHDIPSAAMPNERYADDAVPTSAYDAPRDILVGNIAQRLREANERAFRSADRPWGRSWFSRLFSREKRGD
jgi:hypothetical protein